MTSSLLGEEERKKRRGSSLEQEVVGMKYRGQCSERKPERA